MSSSDKIDLTFLSLPSLSTSLIRPFLFLLRFPIICIYDTPGHKGIVLPVYDFGEWEVECVTFYPGRPFRELAGWLFRDCSLFSGLWENCIPGWDRCTETGFPTSPPINLILLSCFNVTCICQ